MSIDGDIIRLERIPDALVEIPANELHRIFPRPALIHLGGDQPEPLFVSVLLHGNETAGLSAGQAMLKRHATKPWPRAISFFFGNVQAAHEGVRRLDSQHDFNRIWPGTELDACQETRWAQEIYLDELNFTELKPGTILGHVTPRHPAKPSPLVAPKVSKSYFRSCQFVSKSMIHISVSRFPIIAASTWIDTIITNKSSPI